jgi:hypothetical protein
MVGWLSPIRMADGSFKARQNARTALLSTIREREQQRLVIARFEREYAAHPRDEVLTRMRRSAGLS